MLRSNDLRTIWERNQFGILYALFHGRSSCMKGLVNEYFSGCSTKIKCYQCPTCVTQYSLNSNSMIDDLKQYLNALGHNIDPVLLSLDIISKIFHGTMHSHKKLKFSSLPAFSKYRYLTIQKIIIALGLCCLQGKATFIRHLDFNGELKNISVKLY